MTEPEPAPAEVAPVEPAEIEPGPTQAAPPEMPEPEPTPTDAENAHIYSELEAARKKDRRVGLIILIVSFALGLGLSLWAKVASRPEVAAPPGPPSTAGIDGYPSAVDVIHTLGAARAATKRPQLRGIWAEGVKSDGKIDLGEGPGRARYTFQSPEGQGAQPEREPGTLPKRHYCGRQTVHLRHEGLVADPDITDFPCPTQPTDALPEPRCGLVEIWRFAIKKGAPADRLARIEYYRSRAGPAWRFELPGTPHHFSLYGDCGRELEENDAVSISP